MLLTPVSIMVRYNQLDKSSFLISNTFIPVKESVISYLRQESDGKPFSSYHFVSDIYDYSYQYLYFHQALHGEKLPVEFSYQPRESIYIVQKPDLLQHFSDQQMKGEPELLFYVVEGDGTNEFLGSWWDHQEYSEIISEKKFSDSMTVYTALPK